MPYISYFTGDTSNVVKPTQYRLCLMGGATEDDNAMKWFLNGSGGGDIVVIRVTGSNSYNNYLFSSLGIIVNSVETIVIPSISAANDAYVRRRLREAEAVFIAGGNQNDYISYWKNTAVDSALNYLINVKKIPFGGTSAGMAVQGQAYYMASAGSITSPVALSNPYGNLVTIGNNDFLHHTILNKVITDTHYDNPDRRGRQVTFLARLFQDSAKAFYGIACDEYTAVCIDSSGIAKVYGGFPTYDDNAYFIQPNCVLPSNPENCQASQSLTWNRSGKALKVYAIKGTSLGAGSFDLKNWQNSNATGGSWQDWFVINGILSVTNSATPISCITTNLEKINMELKFDFYPSPVENTMSYNIVLDEIIIKDVTGKLILTYDNTNKINIEGLSPGIYFMELRRDNFTEVKKFVKL
ncbi:MAG: Type 1 glutamine amidotransferase-like domain-containing protein [Bacteroidetes bacterium]|nr:Type 1 glutamine amidotransferase-like domain-containing protein [Bacteroidota bacterium]